MSDRTYIIKSKLLRIYIYASGSRVDPYANLWFSRVEKNTYSIHKRTYRALNIRYEYVMLGSGKKVWRWNNRTPKWIKWLLELQYAIKHRNAYNVDWDEELGYVELPPVSKWQVIKYKIKSTFCKHDWEIEDSGDAENGPCMTGHCTKCGKGTGPWFGC